MRQVRTKPSTFTKRKARTRSLLPLSLSLSLFLSLSLTFDLFLKIVCCLLLLKSTGSRLVRKKMAGGVNFMDLWALFLINGNKG